MLGRILSAACFGLHPEWTALALVTVAALVPFIGKPFNMDDPLFIWAAHQIQAHPMASMWNGAIGNFLCGK